MNENNAYLRRFVPYGLAAFLVGLVGGFITALAPAFVQEWGLPYNNTTWSALALAISSAAFAPILGKLADFIGRKSTLLLGIGIFTLGNALTAAAGNMPIMLLARFITGIGTAAITPVVLSFIVTQFPQEKISRGFSLYMLISSGAVIAGPTLGGLLVQSRGWRFMMLLCTLLGAAVFALCLPGKADKPARKDAQRPDVWGGLWVLVFFGSTLCLPAFGQNFGWRSPAFFGVLLAAALSLPLLILSQKRSHAPILPGAFLARKPFILTVLVLFLTQGLMQANITGMILFMEQTQPNNTLLSSYAISVMFLAMSLGSVIIGPLADKNAPKRVLTFSLSITLAGCLFMLAFTRSTPAWLLFASLGLLGFGLGGNGTVFMKVALSGVPAHLSGSGTGTYGLFRDLSAPFGVAVLLPLFTNHLQSLLAAGTHASFAAVDAITKMATAELIGVAAGILLVQLLPKNQ